MAGFTFIELLISIAIILILLGLLLPLGLVLRRNAKRQACMVAFEHVKNAQAIYFSKRGSLVDETTAANWFVVVGSAAPRPMTSMEYFVLTIRKGCGDAYTHLTLLGDQLAVSSEQNGESVASHTCYGTIRVYPSETDANAKKNLLFTLYDPYPGNPDVPKELVGKLDETNSGPLYTVIDPWDKERWDASLWQKTTIDTPIAKTFMWRPHEMDCRRLTAQYDIARTDPAKPLYPWYVDDTLIPPFIPFSESLVVSSPGPDGLWGTLTNRGIPLKTSPKPPFELAEGSADAQAKDNLYSSQRMQ